MKRALAERAKQHADAQQQQQQRNAPGSPARKGQRMGRTSMTPSSPRPSSKKRQRPPSPTVDNDDDSDAEDRNVDAFYLKHQNKQLASELMSYKREISLLERERTIRRKECKRIGQVLSQMEGIFRTGETFILGHSVSSTSSMAQIQQDCCSNIINHFVSPQSISSTGKGTDVETIQNISDALSRIIQSPIFHNNNSNNNNSSSTHLNQIKSNPETTHESMKKEQHDSYQHQFKTEDDLQNEMHNALVEEKYLSSILSASNENNLDDDDENKAAGTMAVRTFGQRWFFYHKRILEIVQPILEYYRNLSKNLSHGGNNDPFKHKTLFDSVTLHKQISDLQHAKDELTSQVDELSKARDGAIESERKVRRGLYRLASGRWKIAEVLKAIDNDKASLADFADLHENIVAGSCSSGLSNVGSNNAESLKSIEDNDAENDGNGASSAEVSQLKKQLQDMEQIAESREKRISELLEGREKINLQLNSVIVSQAEKISEKKVSEDDIKCSDLYTETMSKLLTSQKEVKKLKIELKLIGNRWAQTKGDLILASKTIADTEEKHARRWKELTCSNGESSDIDSLTNGSPKELENLALSHERKFINDAKKIVELEHKLNHALENVRQSENIRASLTEANRINETLQSKLEELKVKNAALVANKATARASSLDGSSSSHSSSYKSSRESSGSHLSHEKLQRDYRKLKKELSAALQSKEGAKSKQERAEKERDALMKTNVRLVKQSSEKDDMNAKSLSTILHLKHLSEELEKEKKILEKRLKAAEQMALAARLAANAKDRVQEEALREKQVALEELGQTNEKILSLETEKKIVETQLEQIKTQMSLTEKEVNKIRVRCDDLVSESRSREEEKQSLIESCAVAKKEAAEAKRKAVLSAAGSASSRGKGASQFTAEQLTIQVNNLKSRLACPVCNHRDKQVILVRCRHMFCRQCVDKNIKNRSRKCPACAQRFDMKDVGDVWL